MNPPELLFQFTLRHHDHDGPPMRAIADFIMREQIFHKSLQLIGTCLVPRLNSSAAGDIVIEPVELFGDQLAPVRQQIARKLLKQGGNILLRECHRAGAHEHRPRAEILGLKARLVQKVQIL